MPSTSTTVAELLKRAGYTTGAFGKWGLGYIDTEGDPNHHGFDHFYGYNCQALAHNYFPDHLWSDRHRVDLPDNSGSATANYAPELIHQKALTFMEENKQKPFFLYYPTTLPHAELLVPEKEMAAFRGKFGPEKPYEGAKPGDTSYRQGPYSYQSEPHAAFAAMITILDQKVGELLKKLDDLGIADNTLVLFTSNNGPHLEGGADPDYFDSNGPLRGYKRDLYEGGIRVPLIVRWKGKIAPGRSVNEVAAAWDILPTFADVAGVSKPPDIQGHSLLPMLLGKGKQLAHEYLYWEFHEGGGTKAVRKGRWKLVSRNVLDPTRTTFELYDIETDISEAHDLASTRPKEVESLKKLMNNARIPVSDFPFE
ncbi:MAG: sulfatase-like hydrolase/transferase [Chryseolinea sp.]